ERFGTPGCDVTCQDKSKRRQRGKVLAGIQEAKTIALRLGPPPSGFANWTLRLLAAQAVALELVESVSHETLRRTLKKPFYEPKDRILGHSTERRCRVCSKYGGRAGGLCPTL